MKTTPITPTHTLSSPIILPDAVRPPLPQNAPPSEQNEEGLEVASGMGAS